MTDLRALAKRRMALILAARATQAGAFDRPVSQSHTLGDETVRLGSAQSLKIPAGLLKTGPGIRTSQRSLTVSPVGDETVRLWVDTITESHSLTAVSRVQDSETDRLTLAEIHAAVTRWQASLQELWNERAAIIQYEGGETRDVAERRAYACHVHVAERRHYGG